MLDEKRIKEAQDNINIYQQEGLLFKIKSQNKDILGTYRSNYKESFAVAKKLFSDETSNLWVIVCSYYSMFYITNAVLYTLGYKIGLKIVHKVASDSLIALVRRKLKKALIEDYEEAKKEALDIIGRKTDEIIGSFDSEMEKRSIFQYESTEEIKRTKANTSLERAKTFIFEMEKIAVIIFEQIKCKTLDFKKFLTS